MEEYRPLKERYKSSGEYEPTEEDKAYQGWKHLIPFRPGSSNPKTLPLVAAGPLNFTSMHWVTGLMKKAYRSGLTPDDLYDTPWRDSADRNARRFEEYWQEEVDKKGVEKASVTKAIFKMIRFRFALTTLMSILLNILSVLRSAYLLKQLLSLVQNPASPYKLQIMYILLMTLCGACYSQLFASAFAISSLAAVRARAGLLSVVFKKILFQSIPTSTTGELINLISNDGQRIFDAIANVGFIFSSIPIIFAAIYAVFLLGWWGLVGFGVFFVFIPIQVLLSKAVFYLRGKAVLKTEKRVKLMSEIVNAMKLIKMYAWERPFAGKVRNVRGEERDALKRSLLVQSLFAALPTVIPVFAPAFTFLAMTLAGADLTVTQAYVYISILNSLSFPLGVMPFSLKILAEGIHSCGRMKKILIAEDEKMEMSRIRHRNNLIEIRHGYFGWRILKDAQKNEQEKIDESREDSYGSVELTKRKTNGLSSNATGSENQPLIVDDKGNGCSPDTILTLHNITLSLKKGMLLGLCGSVGSGKTSLMQAILGMMRKRGGEIAVDKSKKLAYVAQQAWIMNATVRENIIFGNEFDSQWYNEVVDACALRSDFNQFTAGDQTEIGERGINLSGGQKQRISIARAVYSKPDIILLDDPLSAVDVLVGEHIFNRVLKGLLQHKSILFATHQLQFLPGCHYVLVMKEGKIIEEGTHEGLMTNSYGEYAHLIRSFHNAKEKEDADDNNEKTDLEEGRDKKLKKKASFKKPRQLSIASDSTDDMDSEMEEGEETPLTGKLTKEEELRQEQVSSATYISYIKAAGGFLLALLVSLLMLVYTGFLSFTNYWLSVWTGAGGGGAVMNMSVNINGSAHFVIAESDRMVDNPHLKFYQLVYGLCMIGLVIATLSNAMTYVMFCLRASTSLHEQMFRKLVSSPMRFFDVTPSGQIINRFSKDTDEMDSSIPFISDQFFKIATSILSATVIISIAAPFFLLVVLVIGALFIFLSKFCEKGIQLTKKIDNVTKSPLFSHIATTVQGVGTIQAYKQEAQFLKRFNHLEDKNNMAVFLFDATTRWSSVRLDAVCLLITLATFFLVTLIPSNLLTPALAAMALTYSMNIGDLMQFTVRSAIEVGARFSSVERVHSYIENLEEDAPYTIEGNVPSLIWPDKGAIKFENVDVRYREGLPLVLKNITLDIKPQEKIGIVGRTGSGKSSLGLALFRMLELAGGSITIDGIDISTIGLEDLRSKLSIIPQDPVLFMGTVRYNLDPFNVYSDGDLWSALEKCNVKHTIKNLERKLEAPVVENGENFSVGERQLLCMARALLRHSKILLLDEATAAIDTETDSLIQETLKEAFADCTMLTIAHRLNTVVNDDRILVLDDGEVLEFDTPAALLANKNSSFAKMMLVQESQKQEAVNIVYST